jgi:hypothetical protein
MPLIAQLALVSDTPVLGMTELTTVAAALQKQIARDLSPIWDLQGTISPFVRLEDVPAGYWPVIVRDDIQEDAAGVHCDENGEPLALITSGPGWSVTASHEMMEMLVDPFGNRTLAGDSLKPDQGRVAYLVEVADPVGDKTYTVNGVFVSDFCTPHYYDPLQASGVQYSYTGAIPGPRQLLSDGYITWHDPVSNEWWQQSRFTSGEPEIVSLGALRKTSCGMRGTVDRLAARRRRDARTLPGSDVDARPAGEPRIHGALPDTGVAESSRARAELWRSLVRDLLLRH